MMSVPENNTVQGQFNSEISDEDGISQRVFRLALIAIVLTAVVIRLISIDHNLPHQLISDEGSDLTTAVRLLQGELPQRHVRYHRTLIAYSNMIPIVAVGAINYLDGDVRSVADFQDLYFSNRAEFVFATRVWMSVLTSAAILFAGMAGAVINRGIGLLSALILAMNGFYFHTSLFALPDALGASMVGLAMLAIMRVWKHRRTIDYVLVSFAFALVMLAKLHAITIGIGFLVAHGYITFEKIKGDWRRLPVAFFTDKNFWIAAIAGIIGNIIFNPVAYLRLNDFMFEIERLNGMFYEDVRLSLATRLRLAQAELSTVALIIWRWTIPFMLIAFVAIWQNRRCAPYVIILATMLLLSWTVLSSRFSPSSHFYYWNPAIIPMALMAGIGVHYVLQLAWRSQKRVIQGIVIAVLAVVLILELNYLGFMVRLMNVETTQENARAWIVDNVPADSRILMSEPIVISIPLERNEASINNASELRGLTLAQWQWYLNQPLDERSTPAYNIYGEEYAQLIDSYNDMRTLIDSEDIEYVIFVDYSCVDSNDDPGNNSSEVFPPRNASMIEEWELVFTDSAYASGDCDAAMHARTKISFSPHLFDQVRTGPYIEIYRVP